MRLLAVAGLIVSVTGAMWAGDKAAAQPAAEAVPKAMRQIRQAAVVGDRATWDQLVAAECVWVEPTGRLENREYHAPKAANAHPPIKTETKLSETHVTDHGGTAVLTYREDLHAQVGDQSSDTATRHSEVYLWRTGRWQMVFSAETPIPVRTAASINTRVYADYVGEYQVAPNVIGTVSVEDGKLMLKGTGWQQARELVPLSETTFFVRGFEHTEITFVRDANGRVTHQSSRGRDGTEIRAPKIK